MSGQGFFIIHDLLRGSCRNDLSSVFPCARTDIDKIVRCHHRIFIMLDDDEGVSDIPHILEGIDEAVIIALMKSD